MAPQVTVYSLAVGQSANPMKVIIMLEELNIEYAIIPKKFGDGPDGVKAPEYLNINPNGRVPALIDHTNDDFIVWESGAVMLYVAERFDTTHKLDGTSLEERAQVWQWLMFQISGLGPSQGQAIWFLYQHPVEPHPSVIERYLNETRRIFSVLEQRLAEAGDWLVLGRFTIADIAHFPWLNIIRHTKIDLEPYPRLKAYIARIKAQPSVEKAYSKLPPIPDPPLHVERPRE